MWEEGEGDDALVGYATVALSVVEAANIVSSARLVLLGGG